VTLKERVEENIVLWLLGSLLTGFLSGIATYRTVQEIGGLEPISKTEYTALERKANDSEARTTELQNELSKVRGELDAARREPAHPALSNVIPAANPADFPELRGLVVEIGFPTSLAPRAIEVKTKLQKFGMSVKLNNLDVGVLCEPGHVAYYAYQNETAAVALT